MEVGGVGCVVEGLERLPDLDLGGRFVGFEQGTEKAVLEFGVEDRDADAFGGEGVGVAVWATLDESVKPESAEVVAHLAGVVVLAEVSGNEPAKAFVAEAGDGWEVVAERAGQSHGALIPEAQGSGSLAPVVVGLVDALVERRADGTALTGLLDHKQPLVDVAGFVDQFGEVVQTGGDVEVGRLVDDGLDPQRAAVFEVFA